MSEYEQDMITLIKQIAEDLRWLRQRAEERDRIKQQEQRELLERIEKTHRGPTKRLPAALGMTPRKQPVPPPSCPKPARGAAGMCPMISKTSSCNDIPGLRRNVRTVTQRH